MSKEFFGFLTGENTQPQQQPLQQYQPSPSSYAQVIEAASQKVGQLSPNQIYQNHNQRHPQRQGKYAPPNHKVQYVQQQVPQISYNGPPPSYGQQQGFGQRQLNQNETRTDGFPPDNAKLLHTYPHQQVVHYPPVEYQHHQVVEYPKTPDTVVEYQAPLDHHHQPPHAVEYQAPLDHHHQPPHAVEYHHLPHQTAIVHEPPIHHVEYHHPHHKGAYHHYPTHKKPRRFRLSFDQNPDLKVVDTHLKIPPFKIRLHLTPKVIVATNTQDPMNKNKPEFDIEDSEIFPPPDAFADPDVPPSVSGQVLEHYAPKHYAHKHYTPEHYAPEHYAHAHYYPVGHGKSHANPHRSLELDGPIFKVIQKAIIVTPPPPTPLTTTRAPTTTSRTTTTTTTRSARINARNPDYSVAFTEGSTSSTTAASVPTSTTTRRPIILREVEGDDDTARSDQLPTSSEPPAATRLAPTTTSTTTSPQSTSTSTTREPTTTTTAIPQPTTTATTTTSTPQPTTPTTATTTTPEPTTTTTATTTFIPTISTSTITARQPESRPRVTPAEETTPHTTTPNEDSNEIDERRNTEAPRRRPEPLQDESSLVDRPKSDESSSVDRAKSDESSSVDHPKSFNLDDSVEVFDTNMLVDGKIQPVRFYYIKEPVKLPPDVFQKVTGQGDGANVVRIRGKRHVIVGADSVL